MKKPYVRCQHRMKNVSFCQLKTILDREKHSRLTSKTNCWSPIGRKIVKKVGIGRDSNSPSLHFFELRDELGQRAPLVRVLGPSLQDQLLQVFREIVRDIRSLSGHGGRQNLRTDDVGLIQFK